MNDLKKVKKFEPEKNYRKSGLEEYFNEFYSLATSENLFDAIESVRKLLKGPIKSAKEKLLAITSLEAKSILGRVDSGLETELTESLLTDILEEVCAANNIVSSLKDCLLKLEDILAVVSEKLDGKSEYSIEDHICFRNCSRIVRFWKTSRGIRRFVSFVQILRGRFSGMPLDASRNLFDGKIRTVDNYEDDPYLNGCGTSMEPKRENSRQRRRRRRIFTSKSTINGNGTTQEKTKQNKTCQSKELKNETQDFNMPAKDTQTCRNSQKIAVKEEALAHAHNSTAQEKDSRAILELETLHLNEDFTKRDVTPVNSRFVKLNVGGNLFYSSLTTLLNREPNSMFSRMFEPSSSLLPSIKDENGAYLLDRDPKYFRVILNYLRTGKLVMDLGVNPKGVLEEAKFFCITSLIPELEEMLLPNDEKPLGRRHVVNAIITTPNVATLRFQGINLNNADLSYLDLRNINFKYANLRNAKLSYSNLSNCNFERADMTDVEMNFAVLSSVRMACATMERASCINCNFQDPSGLVSANMEGVNLRNANLEGSDLTAANLRVANLKNVNLKATILRRAILAGADLEMSDLTGSDLHEANLRGANLRDASLELMINPLHMAQAIR